MDINKLILVYVQQSDDHALWSPLSILLSDGKCIFFFFSFQSLIYVLKDAAYSTDFHCLIPYQFNYLSLF